MSVNTPGTDAAVRIRSAVPTFLVADIAATARWYAEHLGFQTAGHVPGHEPYVYASLQRGGAEIMLLSLADYQKPDLTSLRPAGLWDAYVRMEGVHTLYETIGDQPFIKMPLKKQPYGEALTMALARSGCNLLLTALESDELNHLFEELRAFPVKARILAADLSRPESRRDLLSWIQESEQSPDILVNNVHGECGNGHAKNSQLDDPYP